MSLHSGMTNSQRLKAWLAAHSGAARIVLGTRMAVFASLPALRLIVADEEHDPSYKSSEGARYFGARATWRLPWQSLKAPKWLLGSATPRWRAGTDRPPRIPKAGATFVCTCPAALGAARPACHWCAGWT